MPECARQPSQETNQGFMRQVMIEALGLKKDYNNPDDAIWQALSNFGIQDRATRIKYFKLAKAEMSRALHQQRQQEAEEAAIIEEDRQERLHRDAWAHQMRQPRDAWDPTYEPGDPDPSVDAGESL